DDRAAGIVHTLAKQVLAEATLLALEGIRQRLERPVVGAAQDAAAAAIVKQRVDGFLEHALFVAHNDVRGVQLHELLQAVVAVDDAAIQIVEVGSGEASAVQRHQGAQFRRQHRDDVKNHPLGLVAALAESFEHLQALGVLNALLERGVGLHFVAEFIGQKRIKYAKRLKVLEAFRKSGNK